MPGQEGARLADLFKISREAWLSLMQRVDLPWNEAAGSHGGGPQTLLMSSLGLHPSSPPAVGTEVRHNWWQDSVNTSRLDGTRHHFRLKGEKSLLPAHQKSSTRVEVW